MTCASCGHVNAEGQKFCGECGSPLQLVCGSCGTSNPPGQRFCGECGAALAPQPRPREAETRTTPPAAERRLVSLLFLDLVGFTTASEERDAEDTRELLSQYFETARGVIERYGGTVEKFIGDAVMAVWGTPTATEDDAERAVRAALDLVASVPELHPDLKARAGVLTGEAAVTIGAQAQGMVAGDLVNTASRVQSAAEPGTVLVGETTRGASEAAIAYEDTGEHEMKGKSEPMRLFRALRVVANRGGEGRSAGLEAPFVGRERELRVVKDLFRASAEESRAHLVLVTGIGGIGKSRLSWEFEKYVDGLTLTVLWHKGRCPSYGEGVAYWALAEMVRGRAGIVENESSETAAEKLSSAVATHVPDAGDRDWIEPRLAHLLGLADATFEREDLFAAWRLFFELLADEAPTVLVFEDLHWADAGLLDFVEYLVEWARSKPIFVVGLARPELGERRPGFGSATRGGFTGLPLEPLSPEAMDTLLEGLVPGLPDELRDSIRTRAEGIPLYAIETVRMLLNRGQLERSNGNYKLVGDLQSLAVPETLHALVAARLDALTPDERRIVQDASVLGKTFVLEALGALSNRSEGDLEPVLTSLVRKEVFFLELDPRSAERGQYGFLQDLVRRVAYETLARRDRKARHLAAGEFFETSWGGREQEVVEVVASHYLTALDLEPDGEGAQALRTKVRETLSRAGERAASLGASAEAAASFARAAELADEPLEEARLRAAAGRAARAYGDAERASDQLLRAIELFQEAGDPHAAARASADLAGGEFSSGKTAEAIERMERAYADLESDEPDEDLAYFLSQLARWLYFAGRFELCEERNERALAIAERLRLPEALSHALNTKGLLAAHQGRWETSRALIRHALEIAVESDIPGAMSRAYTNLSVAEQRLGNLAATEELTLRSLELARRVGDRQHEWFNLGNLSDSYFDTGKWDEVVSMAEELPPELEGSALGLHVNTAGIARHRGDVATTRETLDKISSYAHSAVFQERSTYVVVNYYVLIAEGRPEDALALIETAKIDLETDADAAWIDLLIAEAALASGRIARAADAIAVVEALPPGDAGPLIRAQGARFRGCVAAAEGDAERAESHFKTASAAFREYGMPFHLACTRLEHGEWLAAMGRAEEAAPLVAEARETFERLRATPWLERADALRSAAAVRA
ncbi:MAG TPA: adenylate/guanylate cyclase domain-containing protein [Gaiellaceae bacterium]|nr:adenylate/guanylate cyclase domain-containing protein [Gaiellaceae bacterium]